MLSAKITNALLQQNKPNALITARYDMTACEMDLVFFLLSKLTKDDKQGTVYELRMKELEQLTGRSWNYQRFFELTQQLRTRGYTLFGETLHPCTGKSTPTVQRVALLASAEYLTGQGLMELKLSEQIRPYLLDLKSNFTSRRLQAVFALDSKYAKRIYQLALHWKAAGGSKTYTLAELKHMLHLKDPEGKEPEQYTDFACFKAKVLNVAVQQINECTDLRIRYEPIKKGRAFDRITFYIDK